MESIPEVEGTLQAQRKMLVHFHAFREFSNYATTQDT
jgi:hypothetical protein